MNISEVLAILGAFVAAFGGVITWVLKVGRQGEANDQKLIEIDRTMSENAKKYRELNTEVKALQDMKTIIALMGQRLEHVESQLRKWEDVPQQITTMQAQMKLIASYINNQNNPNRPHPLEDQ
jgi:midasin (ATPase involved in ribosome maturation)